MSIAQETVTPANPARSVWGDFLEVLSKFVLACLFLRFAIANGDSLATAFRFSTALLMVKLVLDSYFILVRRFANDISTSPYDWLIGIVGTYLVMFYRSIDGRDLLLPQGIQLLGIVMQVLALCSLNTSFGIVAANRGVKTRGLYHYIRHPLYSAYVVSYLGFVLNHPTTWNLALYAAQFLLFLLRAQAEERLLMRSDEYRLYAEKVRWRLIPFVV